MTKPICPHCHKSDFVTIEDFVDPPKENWCNYCEEAFSDDEVHSLITIPIKDYEELKQLATDIREHANIIKHWENKHGVGVIKVLEYAAKWEKRYGASTLQEGL